MISRLALPLISAAVLAGCASAPRIETQVSAAVPANVTAYRLLEPETPNEADRVVVQAVRQALAERGWRETSDKDGWRVEAAAGRLARLSEADRQVAAGLPPAARGGLPVLAREDGSGAILAWRGADVQALGGRRLGLALGETTQESDLFQAMHGVTPPTDLFS